MENQNTGGLSPKELYDQQKRERESSKGNVSTSPTSKGYGGIVWTIVILLIVVGLGALLYSSAKDRVENLVSVAAIAASDWTTGSATSTVTLIEYSDFQCPACGAYHPTVKKVVDANGSNLRFAYRHFPLPQHKNAEAAAYAAEAAGKQGKFWEMHDAIFTQQNDWSELSASAAQAAFESYATTLGLDLAKFKTDSASEEVKNKVAESASQATAAGINSTPTFFLNGEKMVIRDFNDFESQIQTALQSN